MIWKTVLIVSLAVMINAQVEFGKKQRDQIEGAMREMCLRNGAEEHVMEPVQKSALNFADCLLGLVDFATILEELEKPSPIGLLKRYCSKAPELKACFRGFYTGINPCIDETIRHHVISVNNASDGIIDFLCYNEGERISTFIVEDGHGCFQKKYSGITECAARATEDINTPEDLRAMSMEQQCNKYDEVSACILEAMKGCKSQSPREILESLLRIGRKSYPCKN